MKTTRFAPSHAIAGPVFGRSFSDLVDELFADSVKAQPSRESFTPAVDILENETSYELQVSLPGLKKEDIQIQLDDNKLTVSGERSYNKEENGPKFHRVESGYGKFSRTFTLSNDVQREGIQARFEHGILLVTLLKKENEITRSIIIE